jgi:hypothetical protein
MARRLPIPVAGKMEWSPTSIRLHPQLKSVLEVEARKRNYQLSNFIVSILMREVKWEPPAEEYE